MSDRPNVEKSAADPLARFHTPDLTAEYLGLADTGMNAKFEDFFFPEEQRGIYHPERLKGGGTGVGEKLGGEHDAELNPELLQLRKEFFLSVFGMNANDFKIAIDDEQELLLQNLVSSSKKKAKSKPDYVTLRSTLLDYARRTAIPKNFALWMNDHDDIKAFDMTGIPIAVLRNMNEDTWIKWFDMLDIVTYRHTSDPKDKPKYKEGMAGDLIKELTEQIPALNAHIEYYAAARPNEVPIGNENRPAPTPIAISLQESNIPDTSRTSNRRRDRVTWFKNSWKDTSDKNPMIAIFRWDGEVESIGIQTISFGQVIVPIEDFTAAAGLKLQHKNGIKIYSQGGFSFSINGTGDSKAISAEDFFRRLTINGHAFPAGGRVVTVNIKQ